MDGNAKWTSNPKGPAAPAQRQHRTRRSASSTPAAAASGIYAGRPRTRSTVAAASRHVAKSKPKGDRVSTSASSSANGNSNPAPVIHWFQPTLNLELDHPQRLQQSDAPGSDDEIRGDPAPPLLVSERIEAEATDVTDVEDLVKIRLPDTQSVSMVNLDMRVDDLQPVRPPGSASSEADLRHFLGLDQSPSSAASRHSDMRLVEFTTNGYFPASESTFPSSRNLGLTSAKTSAGPSTNSKLMRKPWPGRYKVKVLENIPKKRVKKQAPVVIDPDSPYRAEEFIDVDGQLKLGGKSFEAYITHPQYRLLKDIYAPGIIASRVRPSRNRSRDWSIGGRHSSHSSSRSPHGSPSPAPIPNHAPPGHSRLRGQTLTPVRQGTLRRPSTTTDFGQQTQVHGIELGTQTEDPRPPRRRTVDFDLENTSVEDYDPDGDDNASTQCLTSAMAIWATGDDADTDSDNLDSDTEEELLWDHKLTTAARMVMAILSAQKAGTESLESPLVLHALDNLPLEEHRDFMDLLVSSHASNDDADPENEDKDEHPTESLHRLMDLYFSACNYILGHIRAVDAYEAKYPQGRGLASNEVKRSTSQEEVKILPIETAGDTNVEESMECGVDQSVSANFQKLALEPGSLPATYLRYSPEISLEQFRVNLRARPDRISQDIQLRDTSLRMTYGVNGVSTILSATRARDTVTPISTGNLLLMHNQHASLLSSRIISSKYFLNRVVHQLMTLGEIFLIGKFAKLSTVDTVTPKLYHRLREINVFSGILFQLSSHFVAACKKILSSLQHLAKYEPFRPLQSLTVIGSPTLDNLAQFTVPTSGVLRADDAFGPLLAAFDEIDSIILTGSTCLQALNQGGGVKVRGKYYKAIVGFMEAAKQLERGRELDFGALMVGYLVDLLLLQRLEGKPGEGALELQQRIHLWTNYYELQYLLRELTKLGKKATLISSFASSKSMSGLRKFRNAQEREFGCFRGMLASFRRKGVGLDDGGIEDKGALQDLTLEMDSLEQDKSRLIQMLRAISNESSLSFSIF